MLLDHSPTATAQEQLPTQQPSSKPTAVTGRGPPPASVAASNSGNLNQKSAPSPYSSHVSSLASLKKQLSAESLADAGAAGDTTPRKATALSRESLVATPTAGDGDRLSASDSGHDLPPAPPPRDSGSGTGHSPMRQRLSDTPEPQIGYDSTEKKSTSV